MRLDLENRAANLLLQVEKVRQDLQVQKPLEVLRENLVVAQKQESLAAVQNLVEARNQVSQRVVRKKGEGRR